MEGALQHEVEASGGRCSTLTLRRDGEQVDALGESALVQNGETKIAGWCMSIVGAGGDVDRLLSASLACVSFVAGVSDV